MARLGVGDDAPGFVLPGTGKGCGGEPEMYRLGDLLADGPVVVNFYLFDFHPACTEQLCAFDQLVWVDFAPGVTVVGISPDSVYSSRAFAASKGIEFPLLSDSDGSVAERYGVLQREVDGHRHVPKRSAFVVDRHGAIRYVWRADEAAGRPDWDEVVDTVVDLRRRV